MTALALVIHLAVGVCGSVGTSCGPCNSSCYSNGPTCGTMQDVGGSCVCDCSIGCNVYAPATPSAFSCVAGYNSARCNWASTGSHTDYYELNRTGTPTVISSITQTRYTDTELLAGLSYGYQVRAANACGVADGNGIAYTTWSGTQTVVPLKSKGVTIIISQASLRPYLPR